MKKTLVALAVAASAAVSGSAMAWTQNGTGGSVDLGGTLTPVEKVTPWEVKVGAAVNGLDAQIQKGQKVVDIAVTSAIPVLGIRTQTNQPFVGQTGIAPNIDYAGAIDITKFENGVTPLTIDAQNKDSGAKISTLTASLSAGSLYSWKKLDGSDKQAFSLGGINKMNELFNGGLSSTRAGAMVPAEVQTMANAVFPGVMDNFSFQGATANESVYWSGVEDDSVTHSAFYASGIEVGKKIQITLDQPAAGDQIAWKASLPVTVSYR